MWTARGPLFAQDKQLIQWDLLVACGALLAVVGFGAWAVYRLKRWREETAQDVPPTRDELLQHYQKMVDEGTLDPQEFALIKDQLGRSQTPPAPPSDQPPDTSIRDR